MVGRVLACGRVRAPDRAARKAGARYAKSDPGAGSGATALRIDMPGTVSLTPGARITSPGSQKRCARSRTPCSGRKKPSEPEKTPQRPRTPPPRLKTRALRSQKPRWGRERPVRARKNLVAGERAGGRLRKNLSGLANTPAVAAKTWRRRACGPHGSSRTWRQLRCTRRGPQIRRGDGRRPRAPVVRGVRAARACRDRRFVCDEPVVGSLLPGRGDARAPKP